MDAKPIVAIVMGSRSDWETMRPAADCLEALQVPFEALVMSAHRTPDKVFQYCVDAEANGLRVIIAGAGGAAALAGMMAAKTHLPVLGVPMPTKALNGLDSLLSIVQMPAGIPVGALAIGKAGATNAALLAASILSLSDATLRGRLLAYREAQTQAVLANDKLS